LETTAKGLFELENAAAYNYTADLDVGAIRAGLFEAHNRGGL